MTTQTLNPAAPSAVPNILADRADFRAIARWIEPRSTVLDLGCGDGGTVELFGYSFDWVCDETNGRMTPGRSR